MLEKLGAGKRCPKMNRWKRRNVRSNIKDFNRNRKDRRIHQTCLIGVDASNAADVLG